MWNEKSYGLSLNLEFVVSLVGSSSDPHIVEVAPKYTLLIEIFSARNPSYTSSKMWI